MIEFDDRNILYSGDRDSPRRDTLSVLWAITKVCNYSCSYCVYYKSAANAEFTTKEELLRGARTLLRLGRPSYQLTLYGGEPTHHPHFMELFEYLASADAPVALRIYTNGSRGPKFFKRMVPIANNPRFGFIFSAHPEYADLDKFLGSVEVTAGGGCSVSISFMYVPRLRHKSRAFIDQLYELRMKVPFWMQLGFPYTQDGILGDGRTDEDVAWMEKARAAFDCLPPPPSHLMSALFTRNLSALIVDRGAGKTEKLPMEASVAFQVLPRVARPSFKDFYCCSGANVLFVEEDGAVRGGVCSVSAAMGNIFEDNEFELLKKMGVIKCSAAVCNSDENTPLPKFRDQAEAVACMSEFKQRARHYLYASEANRFDFRPGDVPGNQEEL